jgi:hypothetical protein
MVRVILGQQAEPEEPQDVRFVLVAGLNRLAMAMQLQLPKVPCNLIECTDVEAIELEIRENLNRRQLHGEQRRVLLAALVKLRGEDATMRSRPSSNEPVNDEGGEQMEDKGGQFVHPSNAPPSAPLPNAQPHDKGISAVANETGASRREVRDAVKIETRVTPEAKEAAREADLIDNNSAMLEVASASPEEQPTKVEEIAAKKRKPATQQGTAAQGKGVEKKKSQKQQRKEEREKDRLFGEQVEQAQNEYPCAAADLIKKLITDDDVRVTLAKYLWEIQEEAERPRLFVGFLLESIMEDAPPDVDADFVKRIERRLETGDWGDPIPAVAEVPQAAMAPAAAE